LKFAYAFRLDPFAFRLSLFALDAELIFLGDVVLLGLAVDGGDDGRGQLDAGHQYVVEDDDLAHRETPTRPPVASLPAVNLPLAGGGD
jgi:hypothetical protein